jgi:hypothetical protein
VTDIAALWNRLRADPDFDPEWLRFMGAQPPHAVEHRRWADGATSTRPHVIGDVDFRAGFIACVCGQEVRADSDLTLEDAWDTHRGRPELVAERVLEPVNPDALASDSDVDAFLRAVRNPHYEFA